ncbi:metal ABC transporter ATP-binding protein [Syntrophomonas erecta]
MNRPVIEVKNLYLAFSGRTVLENINLDVFADDFLGIIGPNGGGKTTLLRCLLGLLEPQQGEIRIYGKPVAQSRRLLGYVPQFAAFARQFPVSVREVVLLGRLGQRKGRWFSQADREAARRALQQVEMYELRHRQIGDLSGGEKQRVLVARALVNNPRILFLDEPTASLDSRFQAGFYELLRELNRNMTIVLVSHDISAISTYVSAIACLNRTLYYQHDKEITPKMLEQAYQCPVELIAHGVPHRVLHPHDGVVGS